MSYAITTLTPPPQIINTVVVQGPQGIEGNGTVNSVTVTSDGTLNVVGNTIDVSNRVGSFLLSLPQSIAITASPTFNSVTLNGNLVVSGTTIGITSAMVGLGNVTNTSDINKPVSTAQAIAINTATATAATDAASKASAAQAAAIAASAPLAHVTDASNPHSVTKAQVGLSNSDNTSDINKPVSTAQATALDLKANIASPIFTGTVSGITSEMVGSVSTTLLGIAGGVATLDSTGVLISSQIPAIAITNTFVVSDESDMLELTAQTGDVAVRSDLNMSLILKGPSASTLTDWQTLLTPTNSVLSVAGRTEVITLSQIDVGLSNVTNESKELMFSSPSFTGGATVSGTLTATTFSGSGASLTAIPNSATTATSANTANAIVSRDASGNFTANIITGIATSARYADLAERFAADADYLPGTVVRIGGTCEVTEETEDGSISVFGVVSTQPAYLMNANAGEGSNATHPTIALAGRVPVRVIGIVNKGDYLVSAGQGLARAENNPTFRQIIGRALQDKHTTDERLLLAVVSIH